MKFCQSVINHAKDVLLKRKMRHTHTILIGENASGKSKVFKEYIEEVLSEGENIYYIVSKFQSY